MVKKMSIHKYRKFSNTVIEFSTGVNVISGTNGTCKSSLLHLISNSFQAVHQKCDWVTDVNCLSTINKINNVMNPKVEGLSRGDKVHNDPAKGHAGSLLTVEYYGKTPKDFRRHNSTVASRYAIKPYYPKGANESLPFCPVIYLGLSRLFPYGEFQDDSVIEGVKKKLPSQYQDDIKRIFLDFTRISVVSSSHNRMGNVKIRPDFTSDAEGIDSNTISAGEDNLYIVLTSLISLKYYFQSIQSKNEIESILLIDEFDATLHPAFQKKLFRLFQHYSEEYKIQIIFTTHSMSIIEEALEKKANLVYLVNNVTSIVPMLEPDEYKIKMFLNTEMRDVMYANKAIPIFTEDDEARVFLNLLFRYYCDIRKEEFAYVYTLFHLVKTKIGGDNLRTIFNDEILVRTTIRAICVLDGDKESNRDLSKGITSLPGRKSPEELAFQYSKKMFDEDAPFWISHDFLHWGYGKDQYQTTIYPAVVAIDEKIEQMKAEGISTKGVRREMSKEVFSRFERFWGMILVAWINSPDNQVAIHKFFNDLYVLFRKVAEFQGISSNEWKRL